MLAGPSKHFKTGFALLLASSFLKKYPDGVILFYDSEFGTPQSYFNKFNIPLDSVVHTPITDVEELKFDIMKQLKDLQRDDQVLIIIDSIGNLASKKEVEDAMNEKSVADMSRAKQLKSLFRMITPHLTLKIFRLWQLIILTKKLVCFLKMSLVVALAHIMVLTIFGF
jgi:RecA/RadA recombinase